MQKFVFLFLIMFAAQILKAQEENYTFTENLRHEKNDNVKLGFFGNYLSTTHDFKNKLLVSSVCCTSFDNLNGNGYSIGGLVTVPINNIMQFEGRAFYETIGGFNNIYENISVLIDGNPVEGRIRHHLEMNLSSIGIQTYIGIVPIDNFRILAGLEFSTLSKKDFESNESIVEPVNSTFENGMRTRNIISGQIPDISSLILAINLGLSYDFSLDDNSVILSPEAFYSLGLTDVHKDFPWKINSWKFGLTIKFALY
jgi:hypothetical protein